MHVAEGQRRHERGKPQEDYSLKLLDVEDDDLARDGDDGHYHDDLDVDHVLAQVGLQRLEQLYAEKDEEEEAEDVQKFIHLEHQDRRGRQVLEDRYGQLQR